METSINHQSGGTAAETPKINSKQQPDTNIAMNYSNDDPIILKKAAAMFDCAASSLKNNIKSKKLAATQENEKAPYYVRPSDVERFLRATPGIVSIFHPAAGKSAKKEVGKSCAASVAAENEQSTPGAGDKFDPSPVTSRIEPVLTETTTSEPSVSGDGQNEHPTKRRRRRRGKGRGGKAIVTPDIQPMVLRALSGTTPQERLRLTACLNELASFVASA